MPTLSLIITDPIFLKQFIAEKAIGGDNVDCIVSYKPLSMAMECFLEDFSAGDWIYASREAMAIFKEKSSKEDFRKIDNAVRQVVDANSINDTVLSLANCVYILDEDGTVTYINI